MSSHDQILAQGIAAAKAGDRGTARDLLTRAVRRRPDSEAGWLWLSSVLDTPQGRAHCLRRVLALNPDNAAAQRGLAALERARPAPTIVARPAPAEPDADVVQQRLAALDHGRRAATSAARPTEAAARPAPAAAPSSRLPLYRRKRFWQGVVACLGLVAVGLVAMLAYAATTGGAQSDEPLAIAADLVPTPWPAGTLRPTYTATPTHTPTPTDTPTPTLTWTPSPTPTDTPVPTETATATSTPRPRRRAPTETPTPTPRPTLPPRSWDARLTALGVRLEPAGVVPGQVYWRLVEARWSDEAQSGGKHSIFVEVLNAQDARAVGQPVLVKWADGQVALTVEDRPPPDWGVDFGMYNCLGSYTVSVGGAPSDRVAGLGLGTADAPDFTIHTSFYLIFRLVTY
jgi:hypothetical protein